MKHYMIILASLVFLCLVLTPHTKAKNVEETSSEKMLLWSKYEDSPTIYDIAVGDDYVWGAHPEGAIRWHKEDQTYTIFTEASGLLDSYVTAVEIDHDGNVWFGTQAGLSLYDGIHWTHFTTNNGLVDDQVTSLSIGLNGEIIVGAENGLSIYDGSNWTLFEPNFIIDPNDCLNYGVHDAAIDSNGYIWKSSESAYICYFDGVLWQVLTHEGYSVNADRFEINDNGDMWFAGVHHQNEQGVMLLEADGTWHHFTEADGLLDDDTTSVTIDKNGEVWIGINGFFNQGMSHFDGNTWTSYSKNDGYYGNGVHDIKADDAGDIWTGNNSNVSRFHNDAWQAFLAGPPGGFVYDKTLDSDGHLWISLYRNGVVEFDGEKWVQYTVADGLAGDNVYAMLADSNGDMWFTCFAEEWSMVGKGLTRFDGSKWVTFTTDDGLASNSMNDLTMANDGTVWVAHRYNGVDEKTDTGWVNYTTADGLLSDRVATIYAQGNDIWVGYSGGYSFGASTSKFSGSNWVSYENELQFDQVVNFSTNPDGDLIALAVDGVNEFDGDSWSGYSIPEITDYISTSEEYKADSLVIDKDGLVWIGGSQGVFVFDGIDWFHYHDNTPIGKVGGDVVINAGGDVLWMNAENGFARVEYKDSGGQVFLPYVQK